VPLELLVDAFADPRVNLAAVIERRPKTDKGAVVVRKLGFEGAVADEFDPNRHEMVFVDDPVTGDFAEERPTFLIVGVVPCEDALFAVLEGRDDPPVRPVASDSALIGSYEDIARSIVGPYRKRHEQRCEEKNAEVSTQTKHGLMMPQIMM